MTQAQVVGGVPQLGLKVVKHGVLVVEVADGAFDPAMDRASMIAGRYGGFIETSSTQGVKVRSGMLVIRVPAESFERAVHDLRTIGQVRRQTISGRDVTSRFVDLQARLRNLRTQEAVLRRLLAKAPTVKATLSVQRVLSDVQLGIEELTGQLDTLGNQVDLSTIRLEISEPGATPITAQGGEAEAPRRLRHCSCGLPRGDLWAHRRDRGPHPGPASGRDRLPRVPDDPRAQADRGRSLTTRLSD
jgi:hypothetical protein